MRCTRCEALFAALGAAPAAGAMLSEREQREVVAACYDENGELVDDALTKFRDWWVSRQRDKVAKLTARDVRRRLAIERRSQMTGDQ